MEKYILTGFKGFVGKNLQNFLTDPITIEKDDNLLEKNFDNCDGIFHIGACADLRNPDINEMFYYNYYRSLEIFELAKKYKKKVVFASSSAIYGNGDLPLNSYAWSKYCAEAAGIEILKTQFTSLRFFNIFGPGEEQKGAMTSIPFNIYKSQNFGIFPTEINNNTSPKRDFIYVDDVISACLHAMKNFNPGIYDVGSCEAVGYDEICQLFDREHHYLEFDSKPIGYQNFTCANSDKLLPGWKPSNVFESLIRYKNFLENDKKK